jgi:predicted Na+-dependent transporter
MDQKTRIGYFLIIANKIFSMSLSNIMLSLIIFLGMSLGFVLPEIGLSLGPFLSYFLMILLFFVFLKLDIEDFRKINLKNVAVGLLFIIVLMPLLSLAGGFISSMVFAGILLAFSCPSAASSAFYSNAFGGSSSLAVTLTTISGLASIVLLPIIMFLGVGTSISFNPMTILGSLVQIILIPFVIAFLFKKYYKGFPVVLKQEKIISFITIIFILWGGVASGASYIQGNLYEFFQVSLLITLLLAVAFLVAYSLGKVFGKKTAMTFAVTTSTKNGVLALVIGSATFGSPILLTIVANLIGQNIILMLIGLLKK